MNRKECQKIEKENVSAERSINFFPFRLHNETLDKKINLTHDCQDYYNSLGVAIQEISPLPPSTPTSNLLKAHGSN